MNWYIKVLKNYAVFSGRATRKEYWMFYLFNFIFILVASVLDMVIFLMPFWGLGPLYVIYAVAILIPSLAVAVRRLHDVGKSGWYVLINLIPIAGPIWFLVLMCTDSQPGENKYGPNPKGQNGSGNSIAHYNKNIETHPNRAYAYSSRGDFFYGRDEYDQCHRQGND